MREEFKNPQIKYDPGSDVLSWEVSKKPIDYAKEIGNMIVHFSPDNFPVLVEILEASKFLTKTQRIVQKKAVVSAA